MDKGSDTANNRKQRAMEKNTVSLYMPVGSSPGYTVTFKKKEKKAGGRRCLSVLLFKKKSRGTSIFVFVHIYSKYKDKQ